MKTIISILFMISVNIVNAQTIIEYSVIDKDSTWTLSNSPYIINGDVLIDKIATLTIEKGVIVKFNYDHYIKVQGHIKAVGSDTQPIRFISNGDPNGKIWKGLWLNETYTIIDQNNNYLLGTIMENCIIDNCVYGIKIDNCKSILINSCEIRNSSTSGIYISNSDSTIIKKCHIHDSENGIFIPEDQGANYCVLENNFITAIEENGISYITLTGQHKYNVIRNNTITHCQQTGIEGGNAYIYSSGFENNTITENTVAYNRNGIDILHNNNEVQFNKIFNNGTGIWLRAENCNISNNVIFNNSTYGILVAGSMDCSITSNSIFENYWGLTVQKSYSTNTSNCKIKFNSIYDNPFGTIDIALNLTSVIDSNNIVGNNENYALKNRSLNLLEASNNYWGTSDSIEICKLIYDYYDDFNLGKVIFSPFLSHFYINAPITKPRNVMKSTVSNDLKISWSSNMEADIAGYKIFYGKTGEYDYSNMIDVGDINEYILSDISINEEIAITAYDTSHQELNSILLGNESWYSIAADTSVNASVNLVQIKESNFVIYPNPASETIYVKSEVNNIYVNNIQIVDINGRIVYKKNHLHKYIFFEDKINIRNLPTGIYFLKIDNDDNSNIFKFIKQ